MKQKDVVLIGMIALLSGVFSLILSNFMFPSANRQQQVEVVQPISAEFLSLDSPDQPLQKYFNEFSVNPTKLIQIGDNPNSQPFNGQ